MCMCVFILRYTVQCNISNLIFEKHSNHFYSYSQGVAAATVIDMKIENKTPSAKNLWLRMLALVCKVKVVLRQNEKRKTTVAPLVFRFSFFLNLDTGIKAENGLMA